MNEDIEIFDVKNDKLEKLDFFIRKNKKKIRMFFMLVIIIMSIFLVVKRDELFTKTIMHTDTSIGYSCNETYKYGKLVGEKCVKPPKYNLPMMNDILNQIK